MAKFLYLSKKKEEKNQMKQVLSPAYLPNIEYCSWLLHQKKVLFSETITYQKQSYRNRAEIYGANGKLKLIIPIKHRNGERKTLEKEVLISYEQNWQIQHWKSLCYSYRSSPYFEFYEASIAPFYEKKTSSLFYFNLELLKHIMHLIGHHLSYEIVSSNTINHERMDNLISTKINSKKKFNSYTQVFDLKHGFISNLSIIDLLFNLGPNTLSHLKID
ncbi:MAG: hypothetical protein CMC11_00090 [Flavobacteriaceae bacterium]|nr:hypothetical protein [Flavobacteriaceae bacterium]